MTIREDILYLLPDKQPHGVFEAASATPAERAVFCTVRSVGHTEVYEARALGLRPEIVFTLADYAEYKDEQRCRWNNLEYRIIRTYVTRNQIELTCERVVDEHDSGLN